MCEKNEKYYYIICLEYVLALHESKPIEQIYTNLKGTISPYDLKQAREQLVAGTVLELKRRYHRMEGTT